MEQTPIYLGEQCRKEAKQIWLLSSERPACKVGCWQASRTWNLGRFTPFPELLFTVPQLFMQNIMVYVKQLPSFWESGIWFVSQRLWDQPLVRTWALSFPGRHFNMLSQLVIGELSTPCVTSLGENPGSLSMVFPGLYSMCLLPSLILLCILWTGINLIHEDSYVLSPPGESPKLGMVLGTPGTREDR